MWGHAALLTRKDPLRWTRWIISEDKSSCKTIINKFFTILVYWTQHLAILRLHDCFIIKSQIIYYSKINYWDNYISQTDTGLLNWLINFYSFLSGIPFLTSHLQMGRVNSNLISFRKLFSWIWFITYVQWLHKCKSESKL